MLVWWIGVVALVPVKRYPSNPITPHGAYYFLHNKKPMMTYLSYDETVVFHLMGGLAIPDRFTSPESIRLKELSGLIAPWTPIEQKGATQDGVTFIDSLYDPIDGDMKVEAVGKTPESTAQLIRDWIAAWDAKKPGELAFFDQYAGRWWAPVRWTRNPVDKIRGGTGCRQEFTWPFKSHDAFWRSYDNTASFDFAYEDFTDTFTTDHAADLGPDWPLYYGGAGIGYLRTEDGEARWVDDPDSLFFTGTRTVVNGPYAGYTTANDAQSVSMFIGSTPEFSIGTGAANDIWLRMGSSAGEWNGTGVRARIGWGYVSISAFVNFVETELLHEFELFPPVRGDEFTFSVDDAARVFTLTRRNIFGTSTIATVTDTLAFSTMNSSHRGVGFGMQAGAAVITQATPAEIGSIECNGTVLDSFNTDHATDLGASWPQYYTHSGAHTDGYCRADTGEARWVDNSGTDTQEVVAGPYNNGVFTGTATDNQVVNMVMGTFQEWSFPRGAANDLWARMGSDGNGDWDGYGIRMRIENNIVKLSRFNNFSQTVMRSRVILIPPLPGEKFTLICGYGEDPRLFKVLRNGSVILTHKEDGTGSALGADYRGIGFGAQAGAAMITQATPARIRKISGGDHAAATQSGTLTRVNMGDQPMWDRYTLFGPGTFHISAGPGSTDMVKYGPLERGQTVQLRADPRKRTVVDLTTVAPSPQELKWWQQALRDFVSFASGNNASPLVQEILSVFGIQPPQGNMYSLLEGRFAQPVPPKPAVGSPQSYSVAVEVVNGDADTRIIAAGTPLRRWPL